MNITRTRRGRKVLSLLAIALFTLAFTVIPAGRSVLAGEPAEQVVFSGVATTNDGLHKVGFWIWCMADGNSPNYTGACRGSMHLYDEDNAVGVAGFIVENPDGTYVARVFPSRGLGPMLGAAFHNVNPEPTAGPTNLVQFGVLTTSGNSVGVSPDTVVTVTGPGD
jgi:hypothetical protein